MPGQAVYEVKSGKVVFPKCVQSNLSLGAVTHSFTRPNIPNFRASTFPSIVISEQNKIRVSTDFTAQKVGNV